MAVQEVKCTRCGRVSFAMTRAEALAAVASFNEFYEKLDDASKANYGGPSTLESYTCFCGSSDFVPAVPGDAPDGVTISGVLYEPKE